MRVEKSSTLGFCFGVSHIDQQAQEAILHREGKKLYSYGPLVHNDRYVQRMQERGIEVLPTLPEDEEACNAVLSQLDTQSIVILRAHGVTKNERRLLAETGAELVDGTCPVLLGIYKTAQKQNPSHQIVIIGDPNHPEVIAMKSYFDEDTVVLQTEEQACAFKAERPVFVISQTTNQRSYFDRMVALLQSEFPIVVRPTICNATRDRQQACRELAERVDAMIVVGGKHSSNSQKLKKVAEEQGIPAYLVESFEEVPLQKLKKFGKIGVTAGASTPDWSIEEVVIGMDNFSNEEFMEQIADSMIKIYPRDIVKGTVISVKEDEVYVDVHYRADGIIKSDEMSDEQQSNPTAAFHEGEEIDVYVIKLDDGEGNVVLSTRRVEGLKSWNKLVELAEADETVEAKVTGENSGGLVVNVMGINGFIPASQITTYFVKNFKQFVGQTLECKIISVDERKRRVVLSSRAVKEKQLDEVWEKIQVGEQVKGKVVRMTDFGAFVDLGGVDGLIHVSDISWDRISKPSEVLEIGQEIEPVVLKANRERNRISLGLRQLQPKPFTVFAENHQVGDVLKGTVVNLLDFGAFVRLEEGVEGLVHVSQISNHHVEKPADELTVGQEVEVKVIEIDRERGRIALSIRALQQPEESEAAPRRERENDDRFERRPKKEKKPAQPKRERAPKTPTIDFNTSSDIGTNLGDLIAAHLGLVSEETEKEEPVIEKVETPVNEQAEEAFENEVEAVEEASDNE